jgi:translation elongation factor EF-1alpha
MLLSSKQGKSTIAGMILVGTGGIGERYFNRIKNEFAERNLEGTPFNYAAIVDRKGDNRYKLSTIVPNHAVVRLFGGFFPCSAFDSGQRCVLVVSK